MSRQYRPMVEDLVILLVILVLAICVFVVLPAIMVVVAMDLLRGGV